MNLDMQSEVSVYVVKTRTPCLFPGLPAAVKRSPEQRKQYLLIQFHSSLSSCLVVEMEVSTLVYYPQRTDTAKSQQSHYQA